MEGRPGPRLKIIVVGDTHVGKSSLISRFAGDKSFEFHGPTIGSDYCTVTRSIGAKTYQLMLWDTAGQEQFRSIVKSFFRGAHRAMIVFDIMDGRALGSLDGWYDDVVAGTHPKIPCILVGNKIDRRASLLVDLDEARRWASARGMAFILTSAITGENVERAFTELAAAGPDDEDFPVELEPVDHICLESIEGEAPVADKPGCCT
eukprot:gnl/Chilomastix_cuspidata/4073.p1 GENE.gnl/Chilomastix_cuspidata/4073~~gnl/Chilomastix_cuspidata/4073.p1  ORF type:complete len:205 (-),score=27.40 gnl/Chilomastix_cuspidata/4073:70-684(-)